MGQSRSEEKPAHVMRGTSVSHLRPPPVDTSGGEHMLTDTLGYCLVFSLSHQLKPPTWDSSPVQLTTLPTLQRVSSQLPTGIISRMTGRSVTRHFVPRWARIPRNPFGG